MRKFKNFWIHLWVNIIQHKFYVSYYCFSFAFRLMYRAVVHDFSKLRPCELDGFTKNIHTLRDTEYGSEDYFKALDAIEESVNHHYLYNRHHPEHFFFNDDEDATISQKVLRERADLSEMNLLDIVEMFCDCAAAVRKNKNGDLLKSMEFNSERFKVSTDLSAILQNTVGKL